MVFSNKRKLTLSAWLKRNRSKEYNNSLRLQKFLFFYEAFSKVAGEKADFKHLKGYKNGPVFSNVWGDYTKERYNFEKEANACFEKYGDMINKNIALQASFIVSTLSEFELSALTHQMNIWYSQKNLIEQGISQVPLYEADFNYHDYHIIELLRDMYSVEMIATSEIVNIDNFYFVINKDNFKKLTEKHFDTLFSIIQNDKALENLHNPVYIEIDEEGGLIID